MDKKDNEKKDRLLYALDQGMVMVHLDARRPGVLVPRHLSGEAHLRLNLSYRFDPPDLTVGEWGVRSTLSFNGTRFKVAVPWSALFAITSHVSKEFWLYPDDMPQELIQQAVQHAQQPPPEKAPAAMARPRAMLREVVLDKSDGPADPQGSTGDDDPPKPRSRGHLRVIK
ncbi:MAG: stringent starvation protein B [Myxococcaceae bacterium]|nr:stringent starvation protein B [Myxococcaceae bacterium]